MKFPIVKTANIIGKIDGKALNDRVLLLTANIDGLGEGTRGKYFSGAINSTSGIATLMEITRVIAQQEHMPYKSIVFIGFNGQQQNMCGSDYYIEHPLFTHDTTTVIHLQNTKLRL